MKDLAELQPSPVPAAAAPPPVPPKSNTKPPTSSIVPFPEQLECAECKQWKVPKDFWWCRSCQKTLCSTCNLIKGHTEHRSAPWRPDELVRSLIDSVEARCKARVHRAAEEETAIKEYAREIEKYFLNKLQHQLDERNDDDRSLISVVCDATGTSREERKRWPPASHSAVSPLTPVQQRRSTSPPPIHPTLIGFDLLTDDNVARLVNEIGHLLPPDSGRKLMMTSNDNNNIGGHTCFKSTSSLSRSDDVLDVSSSSNGEHRQSSTRRIINSTKSASSGGGGGKWIPAVLPDLEPIDLVRLLEQQQQQQPAQQSASAEPPNAAGSRSRSQSGTRSGHHNQGRSATPFIEHVSSRAGSPSPGVNGNTLSIYGTLDVDSGTDNNSISSPSSGRKSPSPVNTTTTNCGSLLTTEAVIHEQTEPPFRNSYYKSYRNDDEAEETSTVRVMISEDTQTSPSSWLTSATQTDPPSPPAATSIPNGGGSRSVDSSTAATSPNGLSPFSGGLTEMSTTDSANTTSNSISKYNNNIDGADDSLITTRSSTTTTAAMSVTAFHFGEDYLSRPIDIRPLPDGRLAISDSCGGIYITNAHGEVVHQIGLGGFSASSLCYLTTATTTNHENRYPPLLLVSVLRKQNRCINFYDARDFTFLDSIPCPDEPTIDLGRSRWIAADDRGAVYLVSGDGKMSALWKYSSANRAWTLLKRAPRTRYQYLDVVHTMTDPTSVTLLTCDGLRGSLLLITISRASASSRSSAKSKILAEEDFSQTYGLGRFIRSPASAVVDYQGNMLILDYTTGKLWLLRAANGSTSNTTNSDGADVISTTSDRRLKMLVEMGPQQAVGLSVTGPPAPTTAAAAGAAAYRPYGEHWCYIACYNKKRVHAVKYLPD